MTISGLDLFPLPEPTPYETPKVGPQNPAIQWRDVANFREHDLGILDPLPSHFKVPEHIDTNSLAGYCALFQSPIPVRVTGRSHGIPYGTDIEGPRELGWFFYRQTSGGSHRSISYKTRQEAYQALKAEVKHTWEFWETKYNWLRNGDVTPDGYPVVRAGHWHHVLSDKGLNIRGMGSGGREWTFEMLDGTVVKSSDVWTQGRISTEYLEFLPDNVKVKA